MNNSMHNQSYCNAFTDFSTSDYFHFICAKVHATAKQKLQINELRAPGDKLSLAVLTVKPSLPITTS